MNAFDSDNFATVEPEVLTIGDRWVWKRTDLGTDYPPSSYALSYRLDCKVLGQLGLLSLLFLENLFSQ